MGLGKTLSLLSLVAWHLDNTEAQLGSASLEAVATLIVTPLSSKYLHQPLFDTEIVLIIPALPGWRQQIDR